MGLLSPQLTYSPVLVFTGHLQAFLPGWRAVQNSSKGEGRRGDVFSKASEKSHFSSHGEEAGGGENRDGARYPPPKRVVLFRGAL